MYKTTKYSNENYVAPNKISLFCAFIAHYDTIRLQEIKAFAFFNLMLHLL